MVVYFTYETPVFSRSADLVLSGLRGEAVELVRGLGLGPEDSCMCTGQRFLRRTETHAALRCHRTVRT